MIGQFLKVRDWKACEHKMGHSPMRQSEHAPERCPCRRLAGRLHPPPNSDVCRPFWPLQNQNQNRNSPVTYLAAEWATSAEEVPQCFMPDAMLCCDQTCH